MLDLPSLVGLSFGASPYSPGQSMGPTPDLSNVLLVDDDGAYLVDDDGAYLEEAE